MHMTVTRTVRVTSLITSKVSVILTEVVLTSAAFLSAPKHTVALVGARVEFECSTSIQNLSLRWSYYASNDPRRSVSLFNGLTVHSVFTSTYEVEATPSSGRYNLIIKAAEFQNAGEYICAEDPFAQSATVAFLTILASDPVCTTNENPLINGTVENDELWTWCMVTYIGEGIPLMTWAIDSTGNVKPDETVNSTGAITMFTSKVKMQMNSSADGMVISCKAIFKLRERPGRPDAKETLNYTYIWNHRANVLYGPKNLNITRLSSVLDVLESILCSANGNPSPTYEWIDETGRVIGRGSVLTLEQIVTRPDKEEYTFQCTAANVLASHKTSKLLIIRPTTLIDKASTENINEAETLSISLLVTWIGPSAVALILLVIITILLISKACCKVTEGRRSFDGNQGVSRLNTRPTMQVELEESPYSEVHTHIADQYVAPNESLNSGLDARQGHIHDKAMVEQHYDELTARHNIHAPEAYAQLRFFVNAASSSEYTDYIEIP